MELLERERILSLQAFEIKARERGFQRIAGVDEAGRGPLAGPVVAAACILPVDFLIPGIDDSKKLTAGERETIYALLSQTPSVEWAIGIVDAHTIDTINILQATFAAMRQAVESLSAPPDYLLVDGPHSPRYPLPTQPLIGGDALSQSIAAASILAKVTRDRLMADYHAQWPHYGFAQNKGYGTKAHLQALAEFGPCPIHRFSFAPLRKPEAVQQELALDLL